ncbi:MAG: ABC transporter permease [Bacilli bacterium]|nr:ABC transporter permease [Bacilli bacterium]
MVLNAITLGFIFALLGFGIFLSFKVLNFTDLTAEASFTCGAAISVVFASMGLPFLSLLLAAIGGALAGTITALLHTKLHIEKVLSGILTLTGFYTINLLITNFRPNLNLSRDARAVFPRDNPYVSLVIAIGFALLVAAALVLFFRTKVGLTVRATGDNENMVQSLGMDTDRYKIIGLALSNAVIAISGALFMQYERYYDASFGTGMMVVGVVTIIIGEVFSSRRHYTAIMLLGITLGSIIYRFLYMGVLYWTNQPQYMKLISALSIILFILLSRLRKMKKKEAAHALRHS